MRIQGSSMFPNTDLGCQTFVCDIGRRTAVAGFSAFRLAPAAGTDTTLAEAATPSCRA